MVLRLGDKIPDTFTLTIGSNSYDVEDAGCMISSTDTYYTIATPGHSHVWRNVGAPGIAANDEVTVTLDRPNPPPSTPSYPKAFRFLKTHRVA